MRIRVIHAHIDEVDGIEVLRGLAEGSRLVPTMFAILAAPYLCFACERQEHAHRGVTGKNPLMHQTKIPFMHQDNFRIFSCSKSTIRAPNLGEGQMF